MALTQDQRNRISEEIKKILLSRIESFPDLNTQIRNAPFHSAVLDCFKEKLKPLNIQIPYLIAITSWLQGFNTSMGSGFENISHILSGGYKRKFSGVFKQKVKMTQASQIENIIRDLKSGVQLPNSSREEDLIFDYSKNDSEIDSLGFTVDCYIEHKNEIIAIELKSVRPNSGEGRGEKQKILYAKAALKLLHPDKDVKYFLCFPFDPTSNTPVGYDKERFFNYLIEFKKFFAPNEVLVASEFWDFLSGSKNTMEEILDIIKETVDMVNHIKK
ncbi:TdeIII family type II restriction endonuclease [Candidatus Nomurabacteria bacterium]|nr:TdeIII family type II restriction endonuclease [Candidatus Nomurabacteria bacterium]